MEKLWKNCERISWALSIISIIISFLKGWWTMDDVKSIWNNLTPGKLMFYIILILILFAFFSSIFRRLRYGIPRKWIAKLGLYWDKEINPYCPKCRMLLHGVAQCCDVLHCPNCDQNFNLRFGNKIYALEDAVKDIKNKTI